MNNAVITAFSRGPQRLIFLVELALISIRPKEQTRNPRWRPAHLIADIPQGHTGAALDDKFIVDAADDEAVPERLHGIGQRVNNKPCKCQ